MGIYIIGAILVVMIVAFAFFVVKLFEIEV